VFLCFGAHRYLGCLVYLFCFAILVSSRYSLVGLSVVLLVVSSFPPPIVPLLLFYDFYYLYLYIMRAGGGGVALHGYWLLAPFLLFSSIKKQSYIFLGRPFFSYFFLISLA